MASNGMDAFDDYFQSMLESDPQTAYLGQVGQQYGVDQKDRSAGKAPDYFTGQQDRSAGKARDYFAGQFGNVYNQFLGVKGRELMNRTDPSKMTSFTDFLSNQPFTQKYGALTPAQKGTSNRRFSPSTRFIYF